MARYEVFRAPDGDWWWLDVQADLLDGLNTRVAVPLMPPDMAPKPAKRLNPLFEVEGRRAVMVTQFLSAVPVRGLGKPVARISDRADEIGAALDMVFVGF